jgi:hypothetical protein
MPAAVAQSNPHGMAPAAFRVRQSCPTFAVRASAFVAPKSNGARVRIAVAVGEWRADDDLMARRVIVLLVLAGHW